MKAYCLIRNQPHYRHEAFAAGLKACGYEVATAPGEGRAGDVLVVWNRYGGNEQLADGFERGGGTVLVAENGYIGRDTQGRPHYAIAKGAHNGRGTWPVGGPERWAGMGITLQPWREVNPSVHQHILVCPNRSFGMKGGVMPLGWEKATAKALARITDRPVRIRPHPGNDPPARPLAADLAHCWAVVIWSSSCGVHALAAGIPVICLAPWWICKEAARWRLECLQALDDAGAAHGIADVTRQRAFERLAWAQWTVEEIAAGVPFRHLLSDTRQAESAAAV